VEASMEKRPSRNYFVADGYRYDAEEYVLRSPHARHRLDVTPAPLKAKPAVNNARSRFHRVAPEDEVAEGLAPAALEAYQSSANLEDVLDDLELTAAAGPPPVAEALAEPVSADFASDEQKVSTVEFVPDKRNAAPAAARKPSRDRLRLLAAFRSSHDESEPPPSAQGADEALHSSTRRRSIILGRLPALSPAAEDEENFDMGPFRRRSLTFSPLAPPRRLQSGRDPDEDQDPEDPGRSNRRRSLLRTASPTRDNDDQHPSHRRSITLSMSPPKQRRADTVMETSLDVDTAAAGPRKFALTASRRPRKDTDDHATANRPRRSNLAKLIRSAQD